MPFQVVQHYLQQFRLLDKADIYVPTASSDSSAADLAQSLASSEMPCRLEGMFGSIMKKSHANLFEDAKVRRCNRIVSSYMFLPR